MELELGALIGGLATAAAAFGGLLLTARQIRLSRESEARDTRWRRVGLVRSLVDQFDADGEIQFCLRALDWGVGPLPVPAKHRSLFADRKDVMTHDTHRMEQALQIRLHEDWQLHPDILLYRLCFDHFFTALENLATYGQRLDIDFVHDVGLTYYAELIRKPPYLASEGGISPMAGFVRAFHPEWEAFISGVPITD